MIVVIIAGGSGTRLWPLSTPDYPKHLLTINGENDSLLQKTYQRAKLLASDIYVLTEGSHAHHVKAQIPDLSSDKFIIEPARRGTASCIVAALVRLSEISPHDEPIAFLPADHYIRDVSGFANSFKIAGAMSKKHSKIVLVGIEPDYPATGFGYIQKGEIADQDSLVYTVEGFKEKPNYESAKEFFRSGNYLWNGGYFTGSLDAFKEAMKVYAPRLLGDYEKLLASGDQFEEVYLGFENISIDYALMDNIKDILVVPASFDWMDLGSFGDLHKAVDNDESGNHIYGRVEISNVENSFVRNYEDKPVAVVGLDNVVVVNTPEGILVARKDLSKEVGEVSKRINSCGSGV